jgi:hypothetical protein
MQVVVVQSITKTMFLSIITKPVAKHKASCMSGWGTSPTSILDVTYYSWQAQLPQTSKVTTLSKSLTKAHVSGERERGIQTLEEGCSRGQNVSMLEK